MTTTPTVAMVAGEASGDLLAGLLIDGLKNHWPALQTVGIGGPCMTRRGFQAWWPSEKLSVRGYVEVLRHYREIVGIRNQLKKRLLASPPSVFIGVDAPDFNLDLEAALKAGGIKPFISSARPYGHGVPVGWKKSGAALTTCCAFFLLSRHCWPRTALPRLMLATRWPT